jgi:hypothetical protein
MGRSTTSSPFTPERVGHLPVGFEKPYGLARLTPKPRRAFPTGPEFRPGVVMVRGDRLVWPAVEKHRSHFSAVSPHGSSACNDLKPSHQQPFRVLIEVDSLKGARRATGKPSPICQQIVRVLNCAFSWHWHWHWQSQRQWYGVGDRRHLGWGLPRDVSEATAHGLRKRAARAGNVRERLGLTSGTVAGMLLAQQGRADACRAHSHPHDHPDRGRWDI